MPNLDEIVKHSRKSRPAREAQDDWTLLDIRYTGK